MRNVRILAGAALAITLGALWAPAASAHVTVQPNTATQGSRAKFAVRVPNESDTASTIKVELQTPKDAPTAAAGLRVSPTVGWTVEVEKTKLDPPIKGETSDITEYVSKITWTAQEGYKIGPDQFQEFEFTTGPLPKDVNQLAFKAIQTYDSPLADGSTEARWVEVRQEGQDDPKRPEALVKLTPPTTAGATGSAAPSDESASGDITALQAAADDAKAAADSSKTFGIIGLVLGVIALLVAIGAIVAKPKAAPAASSTGDKKPEPVDA